MKTQTNDTSARVQTYSFDNDTLKFTIDHERVAREGMGIEGYYFESFVDSMIAVDCKTLIHRTSQRPQGGDATDWFIEAISGGEAGGRFRVTSKDKERAANAMKSYKLAPEQAAKQFLDNNGIEYQDDAEWLAKHYMGLRAKKAAEEKAQQNML